MADYEISGRELILLNLVETLENIPGITTVARQHPNADGTDMAAFQKKYPSTMLPLIGVTGGLPENSTVIGRSSGKNNLVFQSELPISISCLVNAPDNPDSIISYWADRVWRELMKDETVGGTALKTVISSEPTTGIFNPYIGFFIYLTVTYKHQNGI